MGFKSPYGNDPSSLPSPVPGNMTLSGLQQAATVPETVNVGHMGNGAAFTTPPQSTPPAPTPSPAPSPTPSLQNDTGDFLSAQETGDFLSGPEEPKGDYLSPDHPIFQNNPYLRRNDGKLQIMGRVGDKKGKWTTVSADSERVLGEWYDKYHNALAQFQGDTIHNVGAGLGGSAGASLAGTPGAVIGSVIGGQASEYLKELTGIKDPDKRSRTMDMLIDGSIGLVSHVLMGAAATSAENKGALAGAQAQTAEGADVAQQTSSQLLEDQQTIKNATGEDMSLRRDQANPLNPNLQKDVNNIAVSGGEPMKVLNNAAISQRARWINTMQTIAQKLKIPLLNSETWQDSALGRKVTNFGDYMTNMMDALGDGLKQYSEKAYEADGNNKHDFEPALATMRQEADRLASQQHSLFHGDGAVNYEVYRNMTDKPKGLGQIMGAYERIRGMNNVDTSEHALSGTGKLSIEKSKPVFSNTESPVETHVQMPLTSEGRPATYGPTAGSNALPPGSQGSAGTFELTQTHPGSEPGALGPEVRTDTGTQPALTGETGPKAVSSSYLPPNESGQGTRGMTLQQIDQERMKADKLARFDKDQKGFPRDNDELAWERISGSMRDMFTDRAVDALNKQGDQGSGQMLKALKETFSDNKEAINGFRKLIKDDPTNAASYLIKKDSPASVKQLLSLVSEEQRKYLAGGLLDSMSGPDFINTNDVKFGAEKIASAWNSYDPEVKKLVFAGQEKLVDAMINVARAIDKSAANTEVNPHDIPGVRKLLLIAKSKGVIGLRGGAMMMERLFYKVPQVADYLVAKAPEVFSVNVDQARAKQQTMNAASGFLKAGQSYAPAAGQAARTAVDFLTKHALRTGSSESPQEGMTLKDVPDTRGYQP